MEDATLVFFALLSSPPPLLLIASAVMTIVDELKMQNIIPETKSISKNETADFIAIIYDSLPLSFLFNCANNYKSVQNGKQDANKYCTLMHIY